MIAEVIPGLYDVTGRRIFEPRKQHHFPRRPMASFLSQPLKISCRDISEIRAFLLTCRYVSDQEQFGVSDHWMTPSEFEQVRKGDCDDFALWTWRQLLGLGYDARFVVGYTGRYGEGHAWVTLRSGERTLLVEPLMPFVSEFPRLETLRYRPSVSVEAAGNQVRFYEHTGLKAEPELSDLMPFVTEWLLFWPRLVFLAFLGIGRPSRDPRKTASGR